MDNVRFWKGKYLDIKKVAGVSRPLNIKYLKAMVMSFINCMSFVHVRGYPNLLFLLVLKL